MKNSYPTVTDQFCGAGGSSLGAVQSGAEVKMALNHWPLAIETHNSNFPNTAHDCTDISACDPRRYPSTDILITSPECTNHSIAKGRKRSYYKEDLFGNPLIKASEDRSRATMWDVPRFTEWHKYNIIIVENVVDARQWVGWNGWLTTMSDMGYDSKCVYFNSQFAFPTPQSRDRMYVVFWRKGNRAPNLDITPAAWCAHCEHDIAAVQTWKNAARMFGRYGKNGQYIYTCPECRQEVRPYYYPALTAIDWSLPIQRIGDRKKPLMPKTMARIQLGLERFANQHILTDILYSHAHGNRSHPVTDPAPTQTGQESLALIKTPFLGVQRTSSTPRALDEALQTVVTDNQHFIVEPQIVELRNNQTTRPVSEPLSTVETSGAHHAVLLPFLTRHYESRGSGQSLSRGVDDVLGTVTSQDHHSLTIPFLSSYYGQGGETPVTDAMPTQVSHDRHALIMPFIASQYTGPSRNAVQSVDNPLPTVPGMAVHYIVQPGMPFMVHQSSSEGQFAVRPVTEVLSTQTSLPHHRLAVPGETPSVDDCGFRMLEPHEIQAAMAFPDSYIVKGNKRERVKQLGNAVTPPVMSILIERCIQSLEGVAA